MSANQGEKKIMEARHTGEMDEEEAAAGTRSGGEERAYERMRG